MIDGKKEKRIIVMGAGAVGGYFGGRLASSENTAVFFVARGEHLKAIQTRGLQVKSVFGDFKIKINASDTLNDFQETADIILFTVKSYDTDTAIELIRPKIGEHTQVLTIQNGLENYYKLEKAFGKHRVIRGVCRIGAMIEEPGVIRHTSMGSVIVGESDGSESERVKLIKDLFDRVDVNCKISGDIERDSWVKFIWNSVFNMITGAAGVTLDKIFKQESSQKLSHEIFIEIALLASKYNVYFSDKDYEQILENVRKLGAFKTSTYQDRMNGKRLEYEAFTGAILRMGREKDVQLPYNEALYGLLSLMDNKQET